MLFIISKNKIKSKEKIILKKHKLAKGFFQAIGLMFFRKSKFNFALIFDRGYESIVNSSIHMFFVFFKINVLFLNNKKEIVDIKISLKPFTLYAPKKPSRYIIELPNYVNLQELKLGDKIDWK